MQALRHAAGEGWHCIEAHQPRSGQPLGPSVSASPIPSSHPAWSVVRGVLLLVTVLPALVAVRALHDTLRWQGRGAVVAVAVFIPSQKLHRKRPLPDVPCSRVGRRTLQLAKGARCSSIARLCQQSSPGGVDAADRRLNAAAAKASRAGKLGPRPALSGRLQAGHARVRGSGLDRQDFGAAARLGETWGKGRVKCEGGEGALHCWQPASAQVGYESSRAEARPQVCLEAQAGQQLRTSTGVPGQPGRLLMPLATPCTHSCVGVVKAWRAEGAA